jgi:uncharacterized protein (TIGR03435 family)
MTERETGGLLRSVGMDFRSLLVALLASGVVALAAQSPAPAFDVVSIKRNVSGSFPVGPEARRGGSFVATNATLVRIVRYAYDLPDYRLAGGPDWVRRDRFDIDARAGRDASSEEIQRMVQSLPRDRFQLVIRQERREGSIYTLVPARNDKRLGPSLHPSSAGCAAPGGPGETIEERLIPNGGVATRTTCAPMSSLVSSLSGALQGPVDDKTALQGLWDYELSYTGQRRRNVDAAAVARDPNDAPALFTAVQEQLGLRLESARGPVEISVIESATQPTDN